MTVKQLISRLKEMPDKNAVIAFEVSDTDIFIPNGEFYEKIRDNLRNFCNIKGETLSCKTVH